MHAVFHSNINVSLRFLLAVSLVEFLISIQTASGQGSVLSTLPALGGAGSGGSVEIIQVPYFQSETVFFTPLNDILLSSITLNLSEYTGIAHSRWNANLELPYQISVEIDDASYAQINWNQSSYIPTTRLSLLANPDPNDGSPVDFTFNCSSGLSLQANTTYALQVSVASPDPAYPAYLWWDAGGNPTGSSLYNGSLINQQGAWQTTSSTPAFSINAVPEPGVLATTAMSFLFGGVYALRIRQKSQRICNPLTRRDES